MYYVWECVFHRKDHQSYQEASQKVLIIKSQLRATSAVDAFAKWARLDRSFSSAKSHFQEKHRERALRMANFKLRYTFFLHVLLYLLEGILVYWLYDVVVLRDTEGHLWPATLVLRYPSTHEDASSGIAWYGICMLVSKQLTRYKSLKREGREKTE